MYINDVHILYYLLFVLAGLIVGQFSDWTVSRLIAEKRVFSKDIFNEYSHRFNPNYILMTIMGLAYFVLLYKYGIKNNFIQNLTLAKYIIIIPMLIIVFIIDYKEKIIPNRLNLTIFETGLVFTFLYGFTNLNFSADMIFGLFAGGGIFLLITLVGGLIAGKEAMGFGDVKLMCGLGLLFGLVGIIVISILSFLIGAIISIILLITKTNKTDEYIPFGPFIVIASLVTIFVPLQVLVHSLLKIFTLGMY